MEEETHGMLEVEMLSVERSGRRGPRGIGLRNVTVKVGRNEIVTLAGETGCGISLLGQLILGISEPGTRVLSGTMRFEGEDLLRMRRRRRIHLRRREFSFLPRNPLEQFNPDSTVQQCLRESVQLLGKGEAGLAESDWSDQFYRVGIVEPERVLAKRVGDLSLLMIRKLGLMRALITRSKLLICDHAAECLDRVAAFQLIELIIQLKEESELGILMLTGSLRGVDQYADRVSVFYEGGILETRPARDLIAASDHLYTRELIRCVPDIAQKPQELPTISREAIMEAEADIHGREAADAAILAADQGDR